MLINKILRFFSEVLRTDEYKKHYCQQDGPRPHTATMVQTKLKNKFGNKFSDKEMWPQR